MKERPILFSVPMSLAIREGRKTMTRRVVHQDININPDDPNYSVYRCPYGQVGDRLWVKESHYALGHWVMNGVTKNGRQKWKFIRAAGEPVRFLQPPSFRSSRDKYHSGYQYWYKRSSLFMRKGDARTWLERTDTRVERLQDISEDDAISEGTITDEKQLDSCYVQAFSRLWESINGVGSWDENPFVWVVGFKKGMRFNEAK